MKRNFITYFFLGIISIFFIMYPVMFILIHFNIVSPTFSNIYTVIKDDGSLFNRVETKVTNIKNNVNNKLTNYLFLYSEINQLYPNIKNGFNINLYNSFNKTIPLGTNTDGEFIFYKDGFYYLETFHDDTFIEENTRKTVEFWNDLSQVTDLSIYLPSRYEFRDFDYSFRRMSLVKEDFLKSLGSQVKVKELNVKDEKEYNKFYYKTDHHWNSYGALQGYYDICEMLNINCLPYIVTETQMQYRGSIGKMVSDAENFDYFTYINTDLKYKATVEGKKAPKEFKPLELKVRKNIYYDQYVGFYNGLYSEVIYDYGNGDENLLIIGDSYSWQIDYILASNFNKTYVLNPKYINDLDIEEYITKNNITKTLVLMETQTTMFDNYNYGYVEKLGGK